MEKDNYIKKWLFEIISWLVIVIYLIVNVEISRSTIPFLSLILILPTVNIGLIIAWFYFRSLRNSAASSIKHQKFLEAKPESQPIPQYGQGGGQEYVPSVTITSELFEKIDGNPKTSLRFDKSFKDYLQTGKKIVFHNKLDYGDLKRVEVTRSRITGSDIEVSLVFY